MGHRDRQAPAMRPAQGEDIETIVNLVNRAYRGESGRKGWTTESDFLDGQRVDSSLLKDTLSQSESIILLSEAADGEIQGCVHIQKNGPSETYLGMLTVDPELQKAGVGAGLLQAAEEWAKATWGSSIIVMTVISLRTELIQWYQKKGYQLTGERKPFPYHDQRFGIPLRQDLEFVVLRKNI